MTRFHTQGAWYNNTYSAPSVRSVSIVVIGDEILRGEVTDTNSGTIARAFAEAGIPTQTVITVGDDAEEIAGALFRAFHLSPIIITTGGLGPTRDDITRTVLMRQFGGELVHDPAVAANVERIFAARGLKMNGLTASQAMVPSSCRVIQNRCGTAPIMMFNQNGSTVVAMPGVPYETEGMIGEVVKTVTATCLDEERVARSLHFNVRGITESGLAERLQAFEHSLEHDIHLAYLPRPGYIRLRLDLESLWLLHPHERYEAAAERLRSELGDLLICEGNVSPAEIVLARLRSRGLTLATAESCTGGNIAHRITSVAGSSDVFLGSVVSYANSVKSCVLGVSPAALEAYGAVSREVVEEMVRGAQTATGAHCAVATSGIAGPGGGSPDKPVGTVWIAWASGLEIHSKKFQFPGNRRAVIERATTEALLGLLDITDHE